jgi:acylphosphatase
MSKVVDRLTASVYGRVQGVSFRYYTRREAAALGLAGWVRNQADGSVVVFAEGDKGRLQDLARFLQHGPPGAAVRSVDMEWSQGPETLSGFEIRW